MGVIPEDLSPPPGPDHDQPGRLSFRGLWVCGICRHSFSRSSGHSEALPSDRITSVPANLCCPCPICRCQSRNHGQRLRDGNQVLPVPAQPPLLREYLTFDMRVHPQVMPATLINIFCVFTALWWRHHGIWTLAAPGQSELHRGPQ